MMLAAGRLYGPDYFIIIAYFVLMLSVGLYFFRYMKGMKDYFTGGNRIPWWLSGVSYYMSSFSAFAFVFYSSLAYQYGLVGVTLYWVTVPAAAFGVIFFATRWRRARIHSPVEYLENRYNPLVRQLFAWQGVPVKIIDDGLKVFAIGSFLSAALSVPLEQGMFWSAVIMLSYTFMGGLWAVVVTDFLQFVVMMAAVLILFPLSFQRAFQQTGGLAGFVEAAPPGYFGLAHAEFNAVYLITAVVLYALSSSINWGLVQRYYCVPDERQARKVGWLVVGLNAVTPPLMFMPAMAARFFLPELADAKTAYAELCVALLPVGLLGLVVAAMFSATMSMLSTDYNVCASVLTNDVYRRLIRPRASQRELLRVGRLTTLAVGVISVSVAFYVGRHSGEGGDKMFRTMVTLFSVATAPVAVPMLLGLLSRQVTARGALAGFLVGVVLGLVLLFRLPDKFTFLGLIWARENAIFCTATLVTLLVTVLISALDARGPAESRRADAFLHRLTVPIGGLPEDATLHRGTAAISPFRVVGICVLAIGIMLVGITPWTRTSLGLILDLVLGGVLILGGGLMARLSPAPPRPEEIAPIEDTVSETSGSGFPLQAAGGDPTGQEKRA
ncbi:MAG: sodium transporter [Phycisphaerae bacterium]|jgi:SSS family transporter